MARSGQGYAGIIDFVEDASRGDYREYVAQRVTLERGKAYYAAFHSSIAPRSETAVPRLGMAFTTLPALVLPSLDPNNQSAYTGIGVLGQQVTATGASTGPDLVPAISGLVSATLPQPPDYAWDRIHGFFTATGAETQLLIGNFDAGYTATYTPAYSNGPGAGSTDPIRLNGFSYHYVDDVTLQLMPTAGPDHTTACGQTVTLGEGCILPTSADAIYAWSPSAGLSNPNALFIRLLAGAFAGSQYTLTITLPNGTQPPAVYTSTTHLYTIPTAGNSVLANCGDNIVLGAECGLPATPGTQYFWTPNTDLIAGQNTAHPTLSVGPNTAPAYTLTVLTPYLLANGNTAYTTSTSTIRVKVLGSPAPLAITTAGSVAFCAGSTLALTASGGDGRNYSWSSPQLPGFSATGQSVTVNLVAGNMTFILTSTTCGAATLNLAVQAQCCLLENYLEQRVRVTPISGRYDARTGSPFNRGPGAIYHVTGNVELYDLIYNLEPGVKVLFDGNSFINLRNNAGLHLNGATLTAACNDMWGGVWVWDGANGIVTYNQANPSATIRSTVEHSIYGLQFLALERTGIFGIENVDFRQNFYSLTLNNLCSPACSPLNGSIKDCTFDSDSSAFKKPLEYRGPEDYYYSQAHIYLGGDIRSAPIDHNTFAHAMSGVMVIPEWYAWADLRDNQFRTCYVAGMLSSTPKTYFSARPNSSEMSLTRNHFHLPAYQPPISQRLVGLPGNPPIPYWNQCHGALLPFVKVEAYNNTFEQAGVYDPATVDYDFDASRPVPDVGLRANLLYVAKENSFTRLGHGMQLNLAADAPVSVLGNTFRDCQVGLAVGTRSDPQPGNMDPSQSGQPELFSSCNTFDPDPNRLGTSTGIVVEDSPGAPPLAFENFDGQAANAIYPLKDLFLDNRRSPGYFVNIDNRTGRLIEYNTFDRQSNDYFPYANNVQFNNLGSINGMQGDPNQSCTEDGFPLTGLQLRGGRQASLSVSRSLTRLEQNVPNPCSGSTTFSYRLPVGTKQAGILIRRGIDGVEVEQVVVGVSANACVLDLRRYAPGLYFCTLTADGAPLQTKRMLVE